MFAPGEFQPCRLLCALCVDIVDPLWPLLNFLDPPKPGGHESEDVGCCFLLWAVSIPLEKRLPIWSEPTSLGRSIGIHFNLESANSHVGSLPFCLKVPGGAFGLRLGLFLGRMWQQILVREPLVTSFRWGFMSTNHF